MEVRSRERRGEDLDDSTEVLRESGGASSRSGGRWYTPSRCCRQHLFYCLICLMICFFLVISGQVVFFFFCLLDWRSAQNFSQLSVEMMRGRNVKTTTTRLSAGSLLSLSRQKEEVRTGPRF